MFNVKNYIYIPVLLSLFLTTGCQTVSYHKDQVQDNSTDKMTVGKVQRQIRVGMSGAEVAQVLGSPNIVSTDEERREVWIYDKISTDIAYSASSGGISALVFGGVGALSGGANSSSGARSTSQKTLTVIIKFDKESKVRDFAYHTSKF